MRGKKGFLPIMTLIVLGAVVLIVLAATGVIDIGLQAKSVPKDTKEVTPDDTALCPDDQDSAIQFQGVNTEDTSGTPDYQNINVSIWKVGTDGVVQLAETTATSALSTALNVDCGETYRFVTTIDSDEYNRTGTMAAPRDFKATRANHQFIVDITDYGDILARAYDEENRGFLYVHEDAAAGGNSTAEITLNAAALATDTSQTWVTTTDGETAYALGNNDLRQVCWSLRTASAGDAYHGVDDWVFIDADSSDYNQNPVVSFNGKTLTKISKGALNEADAGFVAGYELVYKLNQHGDYINSQSKDLCISFSTKSSGTIDQDITILLAPSVWKLKDDGTGVELRIFDDAGNAQYSQHAKLILDNA